MKANELMIGDWVCVWSDDGDEQIQWTAEDYIEINVDYCNPIPLTEEILKANGFESIIEHSFKHSIGAIFERYGNWVFIYRSNTICDIHKAHELQHALRLCGLTELADNFKIKEE